MSDDRDHDSLHDSLGALKARIQKAEGEAHPPRTTEKGLSPRGTVAQLMRIGTDFTATILTAVGLGWLLDRALGWQPWGMLGMLFLGFCGSLLRLARLLTQEDAESKEE